MNNDQQEDVMDDQEVARELENLGMYTKIFFLFQQFYRLKSL